MIINFKKESLDKSTPGFASSLLANSSLSSTNVSSQLHRNDENKSTEGQDFSSGNPHIQMNENTYHNTCRLMSRNYWGWPHSSRNQKHRGGKTEHFVTSADLHLLLGMLFINLHMNTLPFCA